MPARRKAPSLMRPCIVLGLLLATFAALLGGTGSFRSSGYPLWVVQAIDEQVARDPTSPTLRATRAWMLFEQGRTDEAIADLREAIRCNPGDLGQTYQPSSGRELSPEALRHGEAQLQQMLADRPQMSKHIEPGDELWTWAVRKFAGEDTGEWVYWDATDPSPFGGACSPANHGRVSRIRVAPTAIASPTPVSLFDHLWSTAIFELHNVASASEFARFKQDTFDKHIGREDFIIAMIDTERLAGQKTRAFFLDVFWPWCQLNEATRPDPFIWHCYDFYDRATTLEHYRQTPHWALYSDEYTSICIDRAYQGELYDEMAKHLNTLRSRRDSLMPEHLVNLHYYEGCDLLLKDRIPDAIKEFDNALAIDPTSRLVELLKAWAFYRNGAAQHSMRMLDEIIRNHGDWAEPRGYRAYILAEAGETRKALSDLDESIRLEPSYDWLVLRAHLLNAKGDTETALCDLSAATRLEPDHIDAFKARGLILAAQEKWDEAMADFDTAIRLSPTDAEAYAYRGWGYLLTERYELAAADFEHALSLHPDAFDALAGRARLSIAQKDKVPPDWTRVCEDAQRSCELTDWRNVEYIELLATACRESGDAEQAEKWTQKAREVLASQETESAEQSEPSTSPSAEDSTPAEDSSHTAPRVISVPAIVC